MSKDSGGGHRLPPDTPIALQLTLRFDGSMASRNEIPAAELGLALQGWDRFLRLAYYSHESGRLCLPPIDTQYRIELNVRRVTSGSVLVDATLYIAGAVVSGIIGNVATDGAKKFWRWSSALVKTHIRAKREKQTLEGVVAEIEELASHNDLQVEKDREKSEDFVTVVNSALDAATVPLDSAAAKEILAMKGQEVEIEIDRRGRTAIRAPFRPPTLDSDADAVIEAAVRFIRINKKTGTGIMQFVRPQDDSQTGHQRFHAEDPAIRRRANQYTRAFHRDEPLTIRAQRKAYDANRRGHYWLIVDAPASDVDDGALFR